MVFTAIAIAVAVLVVGAHDFGEVAIKSFEEHAAASSHAPPHQTQVTALFGDGVAVVVELELVEAAFRARVYELAREFFIEG